LGTSLPAMSLGRDTLPVNHLTGCLFNEYALRLRPLCSSMSCDVRRLDLRVGNVHFLPEHTQEH